MGLLKNKKGVEGLPFKYIIIALVAALVIGIVLQFTGILGDSIISQAERIDDSLSQEMICQLDRDAPVILNANLICNNETNTITINANITDECGVHSAWAYVNNSRVSLNMEGINSRNAIWTGSKTDIDLFDGTNYLEGYIYAQDESLSENIIETQNKAFFINATCSN